MSWLDSVHGGLVHPRRIAVLGDWFAKLLPPNSNVLDIGCGDGCLARLIATKRPDVTIQGIDVLVRPDAAIPVQAFDGKSIPFADGSFDSVMLVDVLHHTDDPMILLREAARVARQSTLIKDHLADGLLATPTLRLMDWVGNARHGVALPYNYWKLSQWHRAFAELRLAIQSWNEKLGLHPFPADLLFGRSLHFVTRLGWPNGKTFSPAK